MWLLHTEARKSAFRFMCLLKYVLIVEGPLYHIKLPSKIKLQFVSVFKNALKRSPRLLPSSYKIQKACVGGQKSQAKKKEVIVVYLQEDSFLSRFSSTNGIKKAGRKPMIYSKGPGVFCPVA